jgi:ParB family chromosome partitioning protein
VARRSGLGRGLDAILPAEGAAPPAPESVPTEEQTTVGVQTVPIDAVHPNRYQPRKHFDDESLAELTASIALVGVLQPVLVRPVEGGYELVAGERRWRAARAAGLTDIPALVRETDDQAALAQAVVENVQRADLNAIEEAAAYQQLITEFGLTQEGVAERVARSRSAVANTLRLLQLSPGIQRLVIEGDLTAGHARALLGTEDEAYREAIAEQVVADGWSVREVEDYLRLHGDPEAEPPSPTPAPPPGTTKPAALLELEQLLADRLSTRVRLELGRRKGKLEIEFADLEDLERIFRLIS